jgi:hypothetical protein
MLTAYFRSPASLEYYRSGIAGRFTMNGGCGRRCASLRLRPIPAFHNDGLPIGTVIDFFRNRSTAPQTPSPPIPR